MLKAVLLALLRLYQKTLSLEHGALGKILPLRVCRFFPSCSEYMRESLERFGVLRGMYLGLRRLLRCHSLSPGGYDPAPRSPRRLIKAKNTGDHEISTHT